MNKGMEGGRKEGRKERRKEAEARQIVTMVFVLMHCSTINFRTIHVHSTFCFSILTL